LVSKDEKENMVYGTKIHRILEEIDFKCPNYDGLDIDLKNKISNLIDKLDLNCDIYKEYEFMDIKDNKINHGIIDLMLVYDNEVNIIDYKLKNIDDDNYIKQLNGYREYISKKLNKETNCYLYSIIDGNLLEIK
jgi:ATP-dependent helicase/nuclease subunit A